MAWSSTSLFCYPFVGLQLLGRIVQCLNHPPTTPHHKVESSWELNTLWACYRAWKCNGTSDTHLAISCLRSVVVDTVNSRRESCVISTLARVYPSSRDRWTLHMRLYPSQTCKLRVKSASNECHILLMLAAAACAKG